MCRAISILLLLSLSVLAAGEAMGDDRWWINPVSGLYQEPNNWDLGVPGDLDTAWFDVGGSYVVTLDDTASVAQIIVGDDDVEFDLGGNTYTLGGQGNDALMVVPGILDGQLKIRNGSVHAIDGRVVVDESSGGNATLRVLSDGELQTQMGHDLLIGDVGTGSVQTAGILKVTGTTAITAGSLLTIDGGSFSTATIDVGGDPNRVAWNGGAFNLTGSGLNVGLTGPLGSFISLDPNMPLCVSGTVQIEAAATVHFSGGLLVADVVDLHPGATITAVAVDPNTSLVVESTLRTDSLSGFGPGLTIPAFLNLQLGHSSGGGLVHLSAEPLTISGGLATLTVGYDANATVTIDLGATATSPVLVIGDRPTGSGTVNLDGLGTTWTVDDRLIMGGVDDVDDNGGQGELNITGGAEMASYGGKVAMETGSQATVTVSGAGSRWTTDIGPFADQDSWLSVGIRGTGTLNILVGGVVTSHVTYVGSDLRDAELPAVGIINVEGVGSEMLNSNMRLGGLARGQLHVTNDGTVWIDGGILGVHERGSITVESGSSLISSTTFMQNHDYAGSGEDPIITVRGVGSTWVNDGPLDMGHFEGISPTTTTGADLIIEAGGSVTSGRVRVGATPYASGRVTVDGTDSEFNVTDELVVGGDIPAILPSTSAGIGRLSISNGGRVSFTSPSVLSNGVAIGLRDLATGTTIVDGSGSRLESEVPILIGALGGTGTLEITNGAVVIDTGASIGSTAGTFVDSQGSVLVDAATWDNGSGSVEVGGVGGIGTLELANGGIVTASLVRVWHGSQLLGDGQINGNLTNGGTVTPGTSIGTLSVDGNFNSDPNGIIQIELAGGGGIAGVDFDWLDITGSAALAGTLLVELIDLGGAYSPVADDSFEILTAGALSGTFSGGVSLPTLTGLLTWNVNYDTVGDRVLLEVSTPFTADFDGDGDVDSLDLAQWEGSYGVDSLADADGDGDSDGADFLAWQRQFTGDLSPPLSASTTVPEPSTVLLISGLAAVGVFCRRRVYAT